jgi:hypothetical protein
MEDKLSCEPALTALVTAIDIRQAMARQRRALEGGHIGFGRRLRLWRHIEACE